MEKLVCIQDFEDKALSILDNNSRNYFKSGADDEITRDQNKVSFSKVLIRPRVLRDVSDRILSKTVLGKNVSFPVGVAPTAFQSLVHPRAEIESAKAAASLGTIFVLSTYSNWSIEEIARQVPNGRKWFQLFPNGDPKVTFDLVKRAEENGFEALVITTDAQNFGKKRDTMREPFKLPESLRIANLEKYQDDKSIENIAHFVHSSLLQSLSWSTVSWIQSFTRLPIILKGILTREDALLAVKQKVQGVWVSNHGGRQIDTAISTIDALPEIVKAVDGRCQIFLDSGVRRGTDVYKALALGANMVFVGRPPIWGVAVGGEKGAKKVLEILQDELDLTMALSGVANVGDISEDCVKCNSKL